MKTYSKTSVLAEAHQLLHAPTFTKEDSARASGLIQLAETLHEESDREPQPGRHREIEARLPIDREFRAYLSLGRDGLDPERRSVIARQLQAALSSSDTAGGYLVPQPFADRVESLLVQYDEIFDVCTIYTTETGRACGFPLTDDAGIGAAVVVENGTSSTSADVVFGNIAFPSASTWRTGMVCASTELVEDSKFDFQALLAKAFARRFAKGCGAAAITALLASATAGVTAASTSAITSDEVLDLIASVDAAYSDNPSSGFLMRKSTFNALRKLKGSSGNYALRVERDSNGNPLLEGYRVYISNSMGDLSASAKACAFGDLGMVIRRLVKDSLVIRTYIERYAEHGQIAYEGFVRTDFDLAKSSTVVPVKFLQMHS